ncbi:SUMF1/EgtB/PvdO family nonheme iron enzyme [Mucilaginibacter lappiensis]|uniref:Gliding motility-associated lipoprotein GldJ n=1 Tax=Mucilaginibacter lappiensis TaxID=354630 RepID=A0A1N7DUN2_9SPHI|nr:SUMF1/EgtB/PvdO family nonheme iron enzyme [Mucilaginibacter lappiensis]MBB6111456.1 gliding motility-associated lipoprotein GldJ [Mucilaginibacter lappiensis]MBB6130206.1 gliding motility-associated lipoprotein GldJ [Mucilaginibacter lappiensis]SIR79567.1 gliding motility-associated lipoprotein GldJ [Mucilaginibacter lappiensis]
MKILFTKTAFVLLAVSAVVSSCSKQHETSQKTGIAYNDKTNGGYVRFRQTHPSPGPGLVPIEGGTFVMGGSADQDVAYDYNNVRRRVTVPSFYMDETEVSNQDWLDYLHWTAITFPNDRELYYDALPDTLVWRKPLSYNEPYVDNYLRHPAFQDYPVVGVTWDQAQDYCQWRTDRTNENILRETGRMVAWKDLNGGKNGGGAAGTTTAAAGGGNGAAQPFNTDIYLNGQMKGPGVDGKKMMPDLSPNAQAGTGKGGKPVRPVRMEDGILKQGYRLPSEAEWEYAALALAGNTQFENIDDGKMYPWNGLGVRSAKSKTRGLILANFKRGAGDNAGVGGYLNDKADITAPVRSYAPNDFGLYNMAGNVNEWVADTYRQTSFEEFDDFNPFRGNEYSNKRMADPSKGLYAKDKYGRPIKDPAKANRKLKYSELLAQQGQRADSTNATAATPANAVPANGNAANANALLATKNSGKAFNPDLRGEKDTVNLALYGNTTLVNNRSKVYKGGSWNDMAYWLNPATRRFMDQDESSAEVGFRCAMTLVGAPEIYPNGKPHYGVKKAKAFKSK